jgi:hypothetical protein
MTQKSYPLNGQPFPDDQWADVIGQMGDGILDDWGNPYSVTVNTNDTVTIGVSSTGINHAVVGGFAHSQDAAEILSVPAVTVQTRYLVGLLYDPSASNVRLAVLTSPTMTGGKVFSPIVIFDRAPGQTLPAATRRIARVRRAPLISADTASAISGMNPLLFLKGTRAYAFDTGAEYIADGTAASPVWKTTTPTGLLYGDPEVRNNATVADGTAVTVARQNITVAAEQAITVQYTGNVTAAAGTNWALGLRIVIDGATIGVVRRVISGGGGLTSAMPLDRYVRAKLTAGTHEVGVIVAVESTSSGDVLVRNGQLEVFSA